MPVGNKRSDRVIVIPAMEKREACHQIKEIHTFLKETHYSVLKPGRLTKLQVSFSYHSFEDTVTNFDKDMFRKKSFCGTNSYS